MKAVTARKAVTVQHPSTKTDLKRALATDLTLETTAMRTTVVTSAAHRLDLKKVTVAEHTPRPTTPRPTTLKPATRETLTTGVKTNAAHLPSVALRHLVKNLLRDTTPKNVVQAAPTPDLPALDLLPTSARTPTQAPRTTSHVTQEETTTPENNAPNGPKTTTPVAGLLVLTPELRPSMPRLPNQQAPASPPLPSQHSRNSSTLTTPAGSP